VHAGRDPSLRDAAGACFAAYDEIARTVLRGLGGPERLAGPVVALFAGLQLRRLATGRPARPGSRPRGQAQSRISRVQHLGPPPDLRSSEMST
jgi:hypothetical protein